MNRKLIVESILNIKSLYIEKIIVKVGWSGEIGLPVETKLPNKKDYFYQKSGRTEEERFRDLLTQFSINILLAFWMLIEA
jgi:hypothetical protein